MGAYCDPQAMDAKWANIADNADQMHLVSDTNTPTDVSNSLGYVAMTKGAGNGDYAIADGPNAGDRKLVMASKEITTNPTGGTVRHVVLWDSVNSRVKLVTTTAEKVLSGSTVYTVPSWDSNDAALSVV